MQERSSKEYWFVAAGTGGHIFPGLSLADEIKRRDPSAEFLFFGTADRMESSIIPKAGFPFKTLKAGRWKGMGLVGRILGFASLIQGFFQVLQELQNKKKPRALLSVGGYVSVPVVLCAKIFGVPVFLIEPNIRAGLANRMLSRFARAAYSVPGGDAQEVFACEVEILGNPLRQGIEITQIRPHVKKILVLGGSQGAKRLCEATVFVAQQLKKEGLEIDIILQTGAANFEYSQSLVQEKGVSSFLKCFAFIQDIPKLLASQDIVLARAGAMTVAELSCSGVPTIFIPFPFAADDHQRVNARILAEAGAAELVDEQDPYFLELLLTKILFYVRDLDSFDQRQRLFIEFQKWARPHATREIVSSIEKKLFPPMTF